MKFTLRASLDDVGMGSFRTGAETGLPGSSVRSAGFCPFSESTDEEEARLSSLVCETSAGGAFLGMRGSTENEMLEGGNPLKDIYYSKMELGVWNFCDKS